MYSRVYTINNSIVARNRVKLWFTPLVYTGMMSGKPDADYIIGLRRRATTTAHLFMGHGRTVCMRIGSYFAVVLDNLNDGEVTTDYAKKSK